MVVEDCRHSLVSNFATLVQTELHRVTAYQEGLLSTDQSTTLDSPGIRVSLDSSPSTPIENSGHTVTDTDCDPPVHTDGISSALPLAFDSTDESDEVYEEPSIPSDPAGVAAMPRFQSPVPAGPTTCTPAVSTTQFLQRELSHLDTEAISDTRTGGGHHRHQGVPSSCRFRKRLYNMRGCA